MKEIHTTNGKIAIVDDEDFDYLNQFKWCFIETGKNGAGYIMCRMRGKTKYMHRLILKLTKEEIVDHINRNRLDNRKANLRICSTTENCQNRSKRNDNSSGYIGVTKSRKHWMAQLEIKGKNHYLGVFETKEDAAKARDLAAIKYFGEFAVLNFPR